ncbi:cyclic nucleotide-binding domain-containing protein [Ferrovibrio sp.]|uniref:cyclic nucleotide-binding domain-containing protein n=1 Tax=Ferrovibrio sp. TaxID=1917215 RepID=UPI0026026C12|nr:cyclic nucleotide-binding domain-containing protein [Ferrovibrio sp.]
MRQSKSDGLLCSGFRSIAVNLHMQISGIIQAKVLRMPLTGIDLLEFPLFHGVDAEAVARLTRDCVVRTCQKGAILAQQDADAEHVHLVLAGRVLLLAECEDADSTVIAAFETGDVLVAAAAILQMPYLVTARAAASSRILAIPAERFRQALQTEHALALAVLAIQAEHWRLLVDHVRGLKLHSGVERLARFLVQSSPVEHGTATFKLEHDRKTIAALLGISPEFVSRGLQQLRQHGVRASGSVIHIDDVDRISRLYRPIQRADSPERLDQP